MTIFFECQFALQAVALALGFKPIENTACVVSHTTGMALSGICCHVS